MEFLLHVSSVANELIRAVVLDRGLPNGYDLVASLDVPQGGSNT